MEGYHGLTDAAFERTFERDKDELRALGVPIEVGGYDPLFEDEAGYRILPSEFSLPPIELDAEEASVVGVAAREGVVVGAAEDGADHRTDERQRYPGQSANGGPLHHALVALGVVAGHLLFLSWGR